MKKNEFTQIKGLDNKELIQKMLVLKEELVNLMMEKNMKKLKNLRAVSRKRKDIAQILTVLRQKQLLLQLEQKKEQSNDR